MIAASRSSTACICAWGMTGHQHDHNNRADAPLIGHHHDLEAGRVGPADGAGGTVDEAEILNSVGVARIDIDDPVTVEYGPVRFHIKT